MEIKNENPDLAGMHKTAMEVIFIHPILEVPHPDGPLLILCRLLPALLLADRFRRGRRRRRRSRRRRRGGLVVGHERVPVGLLYRRHHRVLHHHGRRRVPDRRPGMGRQRRSTPRIYSCGQLHLCGRWSDEDGERDKLSHKERESKGRGRGERERSGGGGGEGFKYEAASERRLILTVGLIGRVSDHR